MLFIKQTTVSREKFEKEIREILERRKITEGVEFQYHYNKRYCFELDINIKKGEKTVECLEITYPAGYDYQVQSIPHFGLSYQMKIGHTFGPVHLFTLEK